MRARAYPLTGRVVAGALVAVSRGSLPVILLLVVGATDPPVTPPVLVVLVAVLAVVPGIAAWLVGRAFEAEMTVGSDGLVIRRVGWQAEIPWPALAAIDPWAVPLPGVGMSLRLRSGRRWRWGLQVEDPGPLVAALGEGGGAAVGAGLAAHPTVVYGRARAVRGQRRWYHWIGRFPLFALVPTAVLFNAHQHIAYGGPLGQYHLLGLQAYLRTFAVYWGTVTIYVILYASVLRGILEAAALTTAWTAPTWAARVRRALESAAQLVYYAGVPLLLGLRFLS